MKYKLKPFNLKLAKAGHSICTRNGKDVRILCWDAPGAYPICGLVDFSLESWDEDGMCKSDQNGRDSWWDNWWFDLIMKEEEKELLIKEEEKNIKPFDLELAKSGYRVCTRRGEKVRIISFNGPKDRPIVGVILDDDTGREYLRDWKNNGSCFIKNEKKYRDDLCMLEGIDWRV